MTESLECQCCKEGLAEIGKPPRQKVKLPISNSTQLKKLAVIVCPHCDGPVATLGRKSSG